MPTKQQKRSKVEKVMHEFGSGKLKSSSGHKITDPKQAIAIAISESKRMSFKPRKRAE